MWRGRDGTEVSVEELALQDYEEKGYKGYVDQVVLGAEFIHEHSNIIIDCILRAHLS